MRKPLILLLTLLLVTALALPVFAASRLEAPPEEPVPEPLDPKVEAMIAWALETAADDTHGYSRFERFGPNYDCSSFVSTALMEGGFELDTYLFPDQMVDVLPEFGFVLYEKGETEPQRGDILVQPFVHVEICMGGGDCVSAHQDYDDGPEDTTGHEIEYRRADDPCECPFCKYEEYEFILRYEPPAPEIIIPAHEMDRATAQ